jgi:hypothetical protein
VGGRVSLKVFRKLPLRLQGKVLWAALCRRLPQPIVAGACCRQQAVAAAARSLALAAWKA